MSVEENKAVARRHVDEILNKGDLSAVDEFIAPNFVGHTFSGQEYKGPEGCKPILTMWRKAFPDIHYTIDDIVAEGDNVVVRMTITATHTGDLISISPTGKKINIPVTYFFRFAEGKEVEATAYADGLTLFQQLGVIPPMGQG